MEYNDFKSMVLGLGSIFNKEYKENELLVLYRIFKKYKLKDFRDAIDSCITSFDKLPSIHQLEVQCERYRVKNGLDEVYKTIPKPTEEDRKEFQEILDSFK